MIRLSMLACLALASCAGPGISPAPISAAPAALITFGQAFDSAVPDAAALSGHVGFVWSDNHGFGSAPGVAMGQYTAAYRSLSQPTAWVMANHPDWIMYEADGETIAYEFGDARYPPLDIANPAVVAFKQAEIAAASAGQGWISLDNVDAENSYGEVGHYSAAGVWTPVYTGQPGDGRWIADNRAYLVAMTNWAHRVGRHVMINDSAGSAYIAPSDWLALANAADGVLIEGWPIDGCASDAPNWFAGRPAGSQFDREFQDAVGANAAPTFALGYLCGHALSAATSDEIAWTTAARLLTLGSGAGYLALGGASPLSDIDAIEPYPTSMNPPIGPCPAPAVGSRPYVRVCDHGLVALNPTDSAETVQVPGGADQFGAPVAAGVYTLAPMSAVVITTP